MRTVVIHVVLPDCLINITIDPFHEWWRPCCMDCTGPFQTCTCTAEEKSAGWNTSLHMAVMHSRCGELEIHVIHSQPRQGSFCTITVTFSKQTVTVFHWQKSRLYIWLQGIQETQHTKCILKNCISFWANLLDETCHNLVQSSVKTCSLGPIIGLWKSDFFL